MTTTAEAGSRTEKNDDRVREILRTVLEPMTVAEVNEAMGRAESSSADTRNILTRIGAYNRYMRSTLPGRQPKVYALDEETLIKQRPEEQNGAEMATAKKATSKTTRKTTARKSPGRPAAKSAPSKRRTTAATSTPHQARSEAPAASEGHTFTLTPYQIEGGEPVLADESGRLYVAKPLELPEGMRQRV